MTIWRGDEHACSIVVINSSKGASIIESIKCVLTTVKVDYEEEVKANKQFMMPTKRPEYRDTFYQDLFSDMSAYDEARCKDYGYRYSCKEKAKNLFVKMTTPKARHRIKKIINALKCRG